MVKKHRMKQHFILGALSALFIFSTVQIKAEQNSQATTQTANVIHTTQAADHTNAQSTLIATQITASNAPQLVRQGPDAIGGIGDWFFSNGTLCAIVSDLEHEGEFSPRGGSLIDLGFCGRADDYFSATYDLVQGDRRRPMLAQSISSQVSATHATIIVNSTQDGATVETRYSLKKEQASQLHIEKTIKAVDGENFNFLSFINFNLRSLEPFILSTKNLGDSNGFVQEDFVERGFAAIRKAARPANTLITISPHDADHGIAYGWHIESATKAGQDQQTPVPTFLLADEWSNALLVLTDDFYVGGGSSLRWFELLQIPLLGLDDDEELRTKEIIYVGKRGDIASITDQLFLDNKLTSDTPLVSLKGQINDPDSAVHINLSDGTPVSHIRPDTQGKFELLLPKGDYQLHVNASAHRHLEQAVSLNDDHNRVNIELPSTARLKLPQGEAMRLIFTPLGDTKMPHFSDTYTGFAVQDDHRQRRKPSLNQIFLAGAEGDKKELTLAAGKYQVYATRGPEYSLEKATIELKQGDQQTLTIDIPRHINPTPDFIASDLHVHSGFSFDNAFAERERVRTFVAEHGEVMVASEHDVAVNYQPIIEKMGLSKKITSIQGVEVTSLLPTQLNPYTNGHANFFPYTSTPYAYRGGVINHEDKRWRDVLAHIKESHPDALSQLNHPRGDLSLSGQSLPNDFEELIDNGQFLTHMGSAGHPFNPHQTLDSRPNNTLIEADPATGVRDIDFDLLEVVNPSDESTQRTQAVRLDWMAFLKQGVRMVATANSDSHHANEQVAVPRNMVAVTRASVPTFSQQDFLSSLKAGNSYGTTGPMLELSLGNKLMGQTFGGQRTSLHIKISTTPWIGLSHVDIQINGVTVTSHELNQNTIQEVLVPLEFNKDSFVTIEVHGKAGEDYKTVYPGMTPYAFSNPIYVDFDGDGQWTPPGL